MCSLGEVLASISVDSHDQRARLVVELHGSASDPRGLLDLGSLAVSLVGTTDLYRRCCLQPRRTWPIVAPELAVLPPRAADATTAETIVVTLDLTNNLLIDVVANEARVAAAASLAVDCMVTSALLFIRVHRFNRPVYGLSSVLIKFDILVHAGPVSECLVTHSQALVVPAGKCTVLPSSVDCPRRRPRHRLLLCRVPEAGYSAHRGWVALWGGARTAACGRFGLVGVRDCQGLSQVSPASEAHSDQEG